MNKPNFIKFLKKFSVFHFQNKLSAIVQPPKIDPLAVESENSNIGSELLSILFFLHRVTITFAVMSIDNNGFDGYESISMDIDAVNHS